VAVVRFPREIMTNVQIAAVFDEMADILEFQGANPFRVRAYRNAARTIGDLTESCAELVGQGSELTAIDGIGTELAAKIVTLVTTGDLPQLQELRAQVPASVLKLMRIPGVGPKKAAALHKELAINDLEMLRAACLAQKVRSLKGFGEKTEEAILKGLGLAESSDQRLLWATADQYAQALVRHLRGAGTCGGGGAEGGVIEQLEIAGSYRRGKETIGDLDLLVVSSDVDGVMDRFGEFEDVAEVLARGDTKMSVRLGTGLQVDLRVVPADSFGAALQYFTGSKQHNVELRGRAKSLGLKVNEWGANGGGGLSPAGPPLDPAGAARSAARVRLGRGRRVAQASGSRRSPRRPAHAHQPDRRQVDARRDGSGRPGPRLAVYRDHRPLAARHDGQRPGRPAAPHPVGRDRPAQRTARKPTPSPHDPQGS